MHYKLSFYNTVIPDGNHGLLWYNSTTNSLVELTRREYASVLDCIKKCKPLPSCFKSLLRAGFIVNAAKNEQREYFQWHARTNKTVSSLSLAIAITNQCNLACRYCFVHPSAPCLMCEAELSRLLRAVSYFFEKHRCRTLWVTWTGGEPLLYPELLQKASTKLMQLCREKKIAYGANLITNGTLLDENHVGILRTAEVNNVQVSLEPSAKLEKQLRPALGTRDGMFETIYNNISLAAGKIGLTIRIALSRKNCMSVVSFVQRLKNDGLLTKGVRFAIGHLHPAEHQPISILTNILSNAEFATHYFNIYRQLWRIGAIATVPYPSHTAGCWSDRRDVFVIDATGNVFKCFEDIFNPSRAIGTISRKDVFDRDCSHVTVARRVKKLSVSLGSCTECRLLPVCNGGCPRMREFAHKSQIGSLNDFRCNEWASGCKAGLLLYRDAADGNILQ